MTGAGRLMPRAMWDHRVVHAAMGWAAAPVQGAARVPLAGTAPEGQSFKANPRRIRSIADSPAVVDEVDVGPPGPLLEQTRLGDCWLPRRGIFSVGETSVENFDQGCHRLPIPDRDCFQGILVRLPAGCSWDLAARLCKASETTLRGRRTEWLAAKVFDKLVEEAIAGYDRIIAPGTVRGRRRRPACTKPRVVVKGPAPTPRTEGRSAGNGRSRPTCSGSPSAGS